MKKLILSKFQKRFLIIYLFINIIALTVNYFGFNLKYTYGSYEVPPNSVNSWWEIEYFIFLLIQMVLHNLYMMKIKIIYTLL